MPSRLYIDAPMSLFKSDAVVDPAVTVVGTVSKSATAAAAAAAAAPPSAAVGSAAVLPPASSSASAASVPAWNFRHDVVCDAQSFLWHACEQ